MQPRSADSMPVGTQHIAKLMERVAALEARVKQLENVTPDYIELVQRSGDPSTPATNRLRIYVKDSGGNPRAYQIGDDGVPAAL